MDAHGAQRRARTELRVSAAMKASALHDKPIVFSSTTGAASASAPAAAEKLPLKAFAAEVAPPRGFRQSDLQAFFREVGLPEGDTLRPLWLC